MYVLGTNVVSELRKASHGGADSNVVSSATQEPSSALFVSVITNVELEQGTLLMERRSGRRVARLAGETTSCQRSPPASSPSMWALPGAAPVCTSPIRERSATR